jgi:arginyl-tRNA synthetase
MKEEIKKIIEKAITKLQAEKVFVNFDLPEILVETPKDNTHGDYSTNIAMVLSKILQKNPNEIANLIREKIGEIKDNGKIEVVGGFINFYLSKEYLQKQIAEILKQKEKFGNLKFGKNKKINVEFISANPTGPLTLGNGRGGFGGDVLANVFIKAGYKVTKEYYINDTGNQIKVLGHSVLKDVEAVYKGEYIEELNKKVKGKTVEDVGEKASKIILEKMIKPSVKKMGIKFDVWFSEKSLYQKKEVDKVILELEKNNFTYKSENAVWFKSINIGDDKDRVLIRTDGIKTYFASDLAYLKNKFERGFDQLFFFLGADHHGYLARLKAGAFALDYDKEKINTVVMQMVRLFENGKEVKMSKRAGTYVTIDELIDEVGLDVARFFFLSRTPDTQFNFDLNLAKEKSDNNPVFKVQYAYARIFSILKKTKNQKLNIKNFSLLKESAEINLIKQIIKLPEIIRNTAQDYQTQRLPQYALDLAENFHSFMKDVKLFRLTKI